VSPKNALSILAALALVGACESSPFSTGTPPPQWIPGDTTPLVIEAQDDRLLMDVTALALQKSGFPIGTGVDPGHLHVTSGWHNSLQPFRGKGYREQCEVVYERQVPRKYKVQVRVKREKNDDILRPLDLSYAKWIPDADDTDRARIVLQHIRSLLDTEIEVGEKP